MAAAFFAGFGSGVAVSTSTGASTHSMNATSAASLKRCGSLMMRV
nr:hypothetical protein [Chthoniobacter flavus]